MVSPLGSPRLVANAFHSGARNLQHGRAGCVCFGVGGRTPDTLVGGEHALRGQRLPGHELSAKVGHLAETMQSDLAMAMAIARSVADEPKPGGTDLNQKQIGFAA